MHTHDVIKGPVITEKGASQGAEGNKVVFWVALSANKDQIKEAIEKAFNVHVVAVNTYRLPGKVKRLGKYAGKTPVRKKAYVTLKEGETIEQIFSGVTG
jgi:large subunit ribosomal protein L23